MDMTLGEIELEFRRQIYAHNLDMKRKSDIVKEYFNGTNLFLELRQDPDIHRTINSFRRHVKLCSGLGQSKMLQIIREIGDSN